MSAFGALAGLTVIDCTRVLGGPYCTQILGDHGAEVIKVEPPQGDEVRDWGPPFNPDHDASYFVGVNRNKRSLGLDLGQEAGRRVLLQLLDDADVLIENYKPGTMEGWGLGYHETLAARFPRLIHARVSGFGATGPLGGLPGYDAVVQAMVGMFAVNGHADGEATKLGVPIVDIGTGLYTAIGVLMALVERQRSGLGQFLDMTLYDCGIALMHPHVANHVWSGNDPQRLGNAHPNIAPYDKFQTATDDIYLAVGNNRAFQRLAEVLEHPEWPDDPRFRTNADRLGHKAELTALLQEALLGEPADTLCQRLLAVGVPAGPVLTTAQMMAAEHTAHRQMRVDDGAQRGAGIPVKLSRTPGKTDHPPPAFGVDGRAILREHGYSDQVIEKLIADGVVVEKRRTTT